jgi:hypothetical protein
VIQEEGKLVGIFRKFWITSCKEAALPGKLFNDFRCTAARKFTRAQLSESLTISINRHKSSSMFCRYNITNIGYKRNAFIDAEENVESQKNISPKYLRLRNKKFLLESLVQKQTTAYRINP